MMQLRQGLPWGIKAWIRPSFSTSLVKAVFLSGCAVYFTVKLIALSVKVIKKWENDPRCADKLVRSSGWSNRGEFRNTSSTSPSESSWSCVQILGCLLPQAVAEHPFASDDVRQEFARLVGQTFLLCQLVLLQNQQHCPTVSLRVHAKFIDSLTSGYQRFLSIQR